MVSVPGYLLVPEIEMEFHQDYDLEENFNHNRRWFFAILGTLGIAGYIESAVGSGQFRPGISNSLPLLLSAMSVAGIAIKAKWGQLLVALVFLAALLCFIGIEFVHL